MKNRADRILLAITGAVLIFCASCDRISRLVEADDTETDTPARRIMTEEIRNALEALLGDKVIAEKRIGVRFIYFDTLRLLYARDRFMPRWLRSGLVSGEVSSILRHLRASGEHGLATRWYHYPELERRISAQINDRTTQGEESSYRLAIIELLLTDGLMRYARDLRFGAVNPKVLDPSGYFLPHNVPRFDDLTEPFFADNIDRYLRSIQPSGHQYRLLQKSLTYYEHLARRVYPEGIPQIKGKLMRDTISPIIPPLANRIRSTALSSVIVNDLRFFQPWSARIFPGWFSTVFLDHERIGRNIYDTTLVDAVRQYQRDNGLLEDGIIGKATIDNLNVSLDDRVQQIRINLERLRWYRFPRSGPYVRVNIPEYYLYAMEDGERRVKMKVCVGERFRGWWIRGHKPMNYETPQLKGEFSYIVLNPQWNVPQSIAIRETYYQALKDPTYLLRHNYRVFVQDSLVNPASIDWSSYNPEKIPFRFVQGAGRGNALGRIKFMFYNDFDVYLHDTPKRLPFRSAVRAVSHGCVRIEEPMAFARFLLKNHRTWDAKKIQSYLNQTHEGKVVFLEQKIPILIDYSTAWVDEAGRIQFREDIYGKDKVLKAAFASIR